MGEWQVAVAADTLEQVLAEVARVIARSADAAHGPAGEWEPVVVNARDTTTLLADWANELLGRSEATSRVYGELRHVRVRALPNGSVEASADVRGRDASEWRSPLKAATYHALSLVRDGRRWRATLLFDV